MEKHFETPTEQRFSHGLIVGKFCPPHEGHLALIRTAALFCERVTVGIFGVDSRDLSLLDRRRALEAALPEYPNLHFTHALDSVPIDYTDDKIWSRHMQIFRDAIHAQLKNEGSSLSAQPIDAVFTSEDYGIELARRFNCAHVCFDPERKYVPISATQFREHPLEKWDSILPLAQHQLCKRVIVVGAESTGTTTLSRALAEGCRKLIGLGNTRWVPEYGREYSAAKLAAVQGIARHKAQLVPWMEAIEWREEDFIQIARTQTAWEEAAAGRSGPLLVCDTDALATGIWHERYLRHGSEKIDALIGALHPRALYILTDHVGVPFEDDDLRDGEHLRPWMTWRFESELKKRELPFIKLSGPHERRIAEAMDAVTNRLKWEIL